MQKKKINSYFTASIFYMLGNGFGQGLMMLSSIIFTRIMTKGDYGLYSTYYSVVSILNTIVGANLFNGLNNAYLDYKSDIKSYRASNLFLSTLVFLSVSVVCVIINLLFLKKLSYFLMFMALVHAYSFFVVNYYNYSANMENKYIVKSILLVLPNLLQILLSIMFIMLLPTSGVNARVIGSTIGVGSCATIVYYIMIKGNKKLVNKEYWKYGLLISVPSVFSSISYMLMSQFDHIMVTRFCGAEETAVYSLIYNIGYMLVAVMQATNGVLTAWLFNSLHSNNTKNIREIQKWYLFVYAIFAIGLLMIAPEIIKILGPESYWNFDYISPFVIGSFFMVMYSFYTTEALYHKKTIAVALHVCSAALINIVLNYLLIPRFGGVGAAYTSAFAYFVLFLILQIYGNKLDKNLFSKKYFLIFALIVVISSVIFKFVYSNVVLRYGIFSSILFAGLIYLYLKKDALLRLAKK